MRIARLSLAISLLVALCPSFVAAQMQSGKVESMKLLTASAGWASTGQNLFWTSDNGRHWKEITPPHQDADKLRDVFFRDAFDGWVLFDTYNEESSTVSFHLARTHDSGQHWTVTPVPVSSQKPDELSAYGWLDFVDPLHGWLVLRALSSSAFSWGLLLTTEDGGKSWQELTQAPIAGRPFFATTKDGWISGNSGGGGLYSTHDGGKTWSGAGAALQDIPKSLPDSPWYEDVVFVDAKHGSLPMYLSWSPGEVQVSKGPVLILYTTEDGGQTWKLDRTLVDPSKSPSICASAVVPDPSGTGSILMAAFYNVKHPGRATLLTVARRGVTTVEAASRVSSERALSRPRDLIVELSFVTKAQGWARTSSGDLLSTADGGATWQAIGPRTYANPARLPAPRR